MNWYKIASQIKLASLPPVDVTLISERAQRDISEFTRSFPNKTVEECKAIVRDAIEGYPGKFHDPHGFNHGNIIMRSAGPLGLHSQGYRICYQICDFKTDDDKPKKLLLIRRLFENHPPYDTWNRNRAEWTEGCIEKYIRIAKDRVQGASVKIRPAELDPNNPNRWVGDSVLAIEKRDVDTMVFLKNMLSNKSQEDLNKIIDFINSVKKRISFNVFNELNSWIELYWDKAQ
jgi:hypothetical protein